jgi:guanylate kinase
MKGNLIIISSPSGGGKGTLIKRVMAETSDVSYSVSVTTRPKRDDEIEGVHYHFVSRNQFAKLIEEEAFLEYANVHGNFYGTSRIFIEQEMAKGKDVILEIDVQGAGIVRAKTPDSIGIFILPPSFDVLKERLTTRNTESEEALAVRLENASLEVDRFSEFDFVVINNDLEKAVSDLKSILVASSLRKDRQMDSIRDILTTFGG